MLNFNSISLFSNNTNLDTSHTMNERHEINFQSDERVYVLYLIKKNCHNFEIVKIKQPV